MKKIPILLLFLLSIPMYPQDLTDSLLYLLEPLEGEDRIGIFEEIGDSLGVSHVCHQIALAHTNMYQYFNALEYHKRAMNNRIP